MSDQKDQGKSLENDQEAKTEIFEVKTEEKGKPLQEPKVVVDEKTENTTITKTVIREKTPIAFSRDGLLGFILGALFIGLLWLICSHVHALHSDRGPNMMWKDRHQFQQNMNNGGGMRQDGMPSMMRTDAMPAGNSTVMPGGQMMRTTTMKKDPVTGGVTIYTNTDGAANFPAEMKRVDPTMIRGL